MASLLNRNGTWYGRHVFYVNGKRHEKKRSFETRDEKVALLPWLAHAIRARG